MQIIFKIRGIQRALFVMIWKVFLGNIPLSLSKIDKPADKYKISLNISPKHRIFGVNN